MKNLLTFLLLLSITFLQAQRAGMVDKSYGNTTGTVRVTDKSAAQSFAVQKDNKLLIGGIDSLYYYYDDHFRLTRRNNNGTIDNSFGTNGQVITAVDDLRKNVSSTSGWFAIGEEPDGKIVTAGITTWSNPKYHYDNLGDDDITVARFLPDGTPDKSFGNKGRVVTNLGYLEQIKSMAIQPDGKIVVAGSSILDIYDNTNGILVVRYNTDGSLDKTFGNSNGYAIYEDQRGTYGAYVALQPDGKIVIGGTHAGDQSLFTVRYLPSGKLDSAFGKYGVAESIFHTTGGNTEIKDIALDSTGRILATGLVGAQNATVVTRYLPNGQPDSSFDGDGKLELYFDESAYYIANTILIQPDNKIAISGYLLDSDRTIYRLLLVGLNEDGSFNPSFGNHDGKTLTKVYAYPEFFPTAAMQSDGKIIVIDNTPGNSVNDTFATQSFTRFNGYKTPVVNNNIAARNTETLVTNITKPATIKISPNPATGYILITGLSINNTTNITLNTADGTEVKRLRSKDAAQYRLSLAGIAAGVYFINVQDENGTMKMKLVKE